MFEKFKEQRIEKRTQRYLKRQAKEEEIVSSLSILGPFVPLIVSSLWIVLMVTGNEEVSLFTYILLIAVSLLYLVISLRERKRKKEEKRKGRKDDTNGF